MKKIVFIFVALLSCLYCVAEDRYHINVLNEISYQQAQTYPKQWEISRYTYTDPRGVSTTRYFLSAPNIRHNSEIVLTRAKSNGCPWQARINSNTYFIDFDGFGDYDSLRVGDRGTLKYDGDRLYFYKE